MAIINPYNYSKPKSHVAMRTVGSGVSQKIQASGQKMDQYLESRVLSAKPEELTYMLYEGLVKFIKKAMLFLEQKDIQKVNENTQRAQAILDELRSTLNMDIEMSQNLDNLYEYVGHRLLIANIEKNKAIFEEALEMAEGFRDTWKNAFNIKG